MVEFKTKFKDFKAAFRSILQMVEIYQERVKFAFECNNEIQVNISEQTISNDELVMGHLIFNLDYLDFSLPTLALIALANFQNGVIQDFGEGLVPEGRLAMKNVEKADLFDIDEVKFDDYVIAQAFSNPDYKNQREIVYDLPMIMYHLKRDLFARVSRISVDKDEIEKFIFEDEKMGIGKKIRVIAENLGKKEKLSSESRGALKKLIKICHGQNEHQKRCVYKDLRKVVNSVASEMINDPEKTVSDIISIYPNLRVQMLFHRFRLDEIYTVYERLEFFLKDFIIKDNLSPLFLEEIDNKDRNVRFAKQKFNELKHKYRVRLVRFLSRFVLRTMESFGDNLASSTVEDMIMYSEVGDEYSEFTQGKGRKVCKYINKLKISKLVALYKSLSSEMQSEHKRQK